MSLVSLINAHNAAEMGGKAASLSRMAAAGIRVPSGFVLPASLFDGFVQSSGRSQDIQTLRRDVDASDPVAVADASAQIHSWLVQTPLSEAVRTSLTAHYSALDAAQVVVRSSAIGEDSVSASFAGQLDSFLDTTNAQALAENVRRCWASLFSARCLAYQQATGTTLQRMGVLVQPQIPGAISGVAFTVSPLDQSQLLIEYVEGGCEQLVSGEVTPHSLAVPRDGKLPRKKRPLLSAAQARELVTTLHRLEDLFGGPQDVEWTFDPNGVLYILQSRPITTASAALPTASKPSAPSGDTLSENAVFSNANINENYPDPVTPLLQSIARTSYRHYFRNIAVAYGFSDRRVQAMDSSLEHIVGVHAQRLYYDVSNIHAVMRMAPMGDMFARWFNGFVGVQATTDARERDLTWRRGTVGRRAQAREMVTIARSVVHQYRTLTDQVKQFEATVADFAARTHPRNLVDFTTNDLLNAFAEFMDIRTNRWVGAGLADGACMVCCGALEAFLDRHFDEPGPVLLHGLLRGLPDIVSSEPPRHLWRLSRLIRADPHLTELFATDTSDVLTELGWDGRQLTGSDPFAATLQTWLEDWGFRCTGELMFRVDSFQEEPGAVIDMLRSYAGMGGEGPDEVIARQGQARLDQTEQLAARLSAPRRVVFRQLVRATGGSLSLRERARLKQALLYRRSRRVVLTLGERLHDAGHVEHPDDALYMHWQELLTLRDGYNPPRHAIAARRRAFEAESQWPPPPPRIILPRNQGWRPPTDAVVQPLPEGDELTGLAAAGGVVTARATVARGQADFHLVNAGDVLVAPQTDPGWATVLFLVKGLVMERGGMLSHGAIIAREFGIPSVVAVDRATERIPQHGQVTVDGDTGHVRIGR